MTVTGAISVLVLVLVLVVGVSDGHVMRLEMQQPRALVPGTTRGFHPVVTIHEQDALGQWTARFHEVKLYGGIVAVGEYYARIKIGGQTIRVQIDTGSATLAVPMAECTSCKEGDMRYDIAKSDSGRARIIGCEDEECKATRCNSFICGSCSASGACCATSDHTKCAFHLSFGDGSGARGVLVNDMLQWGDVTFPVTFGGIRHDSPDFERKQVDGILGMAYPRLACNPACVKPAWESARDYLKLPDLFTMCMTDDGGTITLGDFDSRVNTTDVAWVPMRLANPPSFYNMRLLGDLQVGDRTLKFPRYYSAIMDSGTTLIVFSHRAFNLFVKHLQTYYCHISRLCDQHTWFKPAHCVKISDEDRLQLPTLIFQLEGFNFTLDANEYMINYKSKGPEFWCVGIMPLDSMSGGVDVIFGNTVMKKYLTIYDRANKRLGFTECGGNCDPKKQTAAPFSGFSITDSKPSPLAIPVKEPPKQEQTDHETGILLGVPPPVENTTISGQAPTPAAVAPAPALTQDTTTQTTGVTPLQQQQTSALSEQQHNKSALANGKAAECAFAKSCSECRQLASSKCFWDTPASACLPGEPSKLMCTIDTVMSHLLYAVLGVVIAIVVLVTCVTCFVWNYRRRAAAKQEQQVDPLEQEEALQPLADGAQSDVGEIFG